MRSRNQPDAAAWRARCGHHQLVDGRIDVYFTGPDAHAAIRKRSAESEDHKEAVTAWAEKRRPVFKGR